MRKGLFITIAFVVASGVGYCARGPVPSWPQMFLKRLIRFSSDLETVVPEDFATDVEKESKEARSIPTAPIPSLVVGPVPEEENRPIVDTPFAALPEHSPASDLPPRPSSLAPSETGSLATLSPERAVDISTPLRAAIPQAEFQPKAHTQSLERSRAGVINPARTPSWGDAVGSPPAFAMLSRQETQIPALTKSDQAIVVTSAQGESRVESQVQVKSLEQDWVNLSSRLKTVGVTRFWIEGTPEGSIVFRCVTPLAGRQTMGQFFEAEGSSITTAMEKALRRIILWNATQVP